MPGLAASDRSTIAIRSALAAQGFRVHRWNLGRNTGPTPELTEALRSRFEYLAERHGDPISLVGWSMGGLYAHRLAEFAPHRVRSVITLGSPLGRGQPRPKLDVPTTSIYSRNDGVVPWASSTVDDLTPRHENLEVRSNHFLLGFDPAVIYAIGDRIRRDPDSWEPFRVPRLMRTAFPNRSKR
jgi:pimeloyl-ACP methyl ester carboxylesterase